MIIAHSYGALISAHLLNYIKEWIIAIFLVGAAGFTQW